MKRSRLLLLVASLGSILIAMVPGIVNATRRFLTKSELQETYQRLDVYGTRH